MDYLKEIKTKEGEHRELRDRQDIDYKLFILDPYEMRNYDDRKVPRVDNVTLPGPQSYGKRVIAVLHKAERQAVVKGDFDAKKENIIEDFLRLGFQSADDILAKKWIISVKPFLNSMAALRGWIGARVRVYADEKGEPVFDILPWDMRYATWENGPNGLIWAAYKSLRSKAAIELEYPGVVVSARNNKGEVTDVWDENYNIVWVGKTKVKEEEHGLGYVPVMIQPATMVPMMGLEELDSPLKYYGESIYSGCRDICKELNKIATIVQTLSVMGFKPPLQKEASDLSEDIQIPDTGGVVTVLPGELFYHMPLPDVYKATLMSWTNLNAEYQRATLPYIEFGELAFELSAVAIAKLGEGRDLIFTPIILCLGTGYRQMAYMTVDQYIKGGFDAELGLAGKKVRYTAKQLEGDYDIKFEFHSVSPEQNIASYSVAQAAKALNILPDDAILEEILKRPNPAEDKTRMANQKLMETVPELWLFNEAHRLIDEKRFVEARMVAAKIGLTLEEVEGKQTREKARPKAKGAAMPSAAVPTPSAETEILQTAQRSKGNLPAEEAVIAR